MLPEGTEVFYRGMYGHVRFSTENYMTVCIREFPDERVRDVCLVVYKNQLDQVELVHGNNRHDM